MRSERWASHAFHEDGGGGGGSGVGNGTLVVVGVLSFSVFRGVSTAAAMFVVVVVVVDSLAVLSGANVDSGGGAETFIGGTEGGALRRWD